MLRALCESERGAVQVLGEDEPFWPRVARPRRPESPPRRTGSRRASSTGVATASRAWWASCISSGEPVLVGVADVARRRESLETLVAGLAEGGLAGGVWDDARRATPGWRERLRPSGGARPAARRSGATRCWPLPRTRTSRGARPRWSSRSPPGATSSSFAPRSPAASARCASWAEPPRPMRSRRTAARRRAPPAHAGALRPPARGDARARARRAPPRAARLPRDRGNVAPTSGSRRPTGPAPSATSGSSADLAPSAPLPPGPARRAS